MSNSQRLPLGMQDFRAIIADDYLHVDKTAHLFEVETNDRVYILEFKLDESAEVALAQIRAKKYYQAWWERGKPVTGVGVNFSSTTRNIEQ